MLFSRNSRLHRVIQCKRNRKFLYPIPYLRVLQLMHLKEHRDTRSIYYPNNTLSHKECLQVLHRHTNTTYRPKSSQPHNPQRFACKCSHIRLRSSSDLLDKSMARTCTCILLRQKFPRFHKSKDSTNTFRLRCQSNGEDLRTLLSTAHTNKIQCSKKLAMFTR